MRAPFPASVRTLCARAVEFAAAAASALVLGLGTSGLAWAGSTTTVAVGTSGGASGVTTAVPCTLAVSGPVSSGSCASTLSYADTGGIFTMATGAGAVAGPADLQLNASGSTQPMGWTSSSANASLSDTVQLSVPGAASGSTGTLYGLFVVDGGLFAAGSGSSIATSGGSAYYSFQAGWNGGTVTSVAQYLGNSSGSSSSWPIQAAIPVAWNFTLGAGGTVTGTFSMTANVLAYSYANPYQASPTAPVIPGSGMASASFSDIYWGGVRSLTVNGAPVPNFSFLSDTGFNYALGYTPAATPEPGSAALLGAGLLLVALFVRRRASL